jgi:hypothetical protein
LFYEKHNALSNFIRQKIQGPDKELKTIKAHNKKPLNPTRDSGALKRKAASSYSPTLKSAVPSPLAGLTSEFGMGSGISPPQSTQPIRRQELVLDFCQNEERKASFEGCFSLF